jgi:hypothetical protein
MRDYTMQDHKQQQAEALETLSRGCKGILSVGVGFRRGSLGDFKMALSHHVSLSFLLTADFLKKQNAALRAEGVEVIVHDGEGRDVELKRVEAEPS